MNLKNKVIIFSSILISIVIIICSSYSVKATEKDKLHVIKISTSIENEEIKSNMLNKTIIDNGININLTYKSSKMGKDIYVDNKECEYVYDNEEMVGFLKPINKEAIKTEKLGEEKARSIAEKFLEENVINFSKYQLVGCTYINSYNEYKITYMNKLNNINTQDIVDININDLGEITSFLGINQGRFEKYNEKDLNINKVSQLIKDDINDTYAEKVNKLKIQSQELAIENDKLVLISNVSIMLKNNNKNDFTGTCVENISYSYELE